MRNKFIQVTIGDDDNVNYRKFITVEITNTAYCSLRNYDKGYDDAWDTLCDTIAATNSDLPYNWFINSIIF